MMIILFTDFGVDDIYVGQIHAVLAEKAPGIPVIDLLHAAPNYDIVASAYLLGALRSRIPPGSVFMAVVDPGVGSDRAVLMVEADERWFVAPDNGLLTGIIVNASQPTAARVLWTPADVSPSFHGRDLFAPVAAMLASGITPEHEAINPLLLEWSPDLYRIIYIDHYGNAITGIRAGSTSTHDRVSICNRELDYARVFSDKAEGELFWYINSLDLVEIAANQARAQEILDLNIGDPLKIIPPGAGLKC